MDTSWNNLGKAFWNGGIFGVAKTMLNERRVRPQTDDPLPNWKVFPLSETTDLLELSLEMFHSGQLSSAERAQRTNKAHEIKDFMGMDNLCEVPVRIDL